MTHRQRGAEVERPQASKNVNRSCGRPCAVDSSGRHDETSLGMVCRRYYRYLRGSRVLHSESENRPVARTALSARALKEIASVEAEINRIEGQMLADVQHRSLDPSQKIILLGKLIFYDQHLSVRRNEACAFCHMPETGFSGPVSALNQTTVSYPGSIRDALRRPESPNSHLRQLRARITLQRAPRRSGGRSLLGHARDGLRLNSPLAEQAQGPPLDPDEMGMIDAACVVYRLSERPYRHLAEQVWGAQAFAIRWPRDVKTVCDRPGPAPDSDPLPVHLASVDRGIAQGTFDQIAQSIAAYEGSTEVNPFSSKYDYVMAGKAQFTPDEKMGYTLFRSKATHCNECHRDGGPGEEPLFTDFTASNLGLPPNPAIPFYRENVPDKFGYASNPLGRNFLDPGVGGFLRRPVGSGPRVGATWPHPSSANTKLPRCVTWTRDRGPISSRPTCTTAI